MGGRRADACWPVAGHYSRDLPAVKPKLGFGQMGRRGMGAFPFLHTVIL